MSWRDDISLVRNWRAYVVIGAALVLFGVVGRMEMDDQIAYDRAAWEIQAGARHGL